MLFAKAKVWRTSALEWSCSEMLRNGERSWGSVEELRKDGEIKGQGEEHDLTHPISVLN
jgi:hypothetical protein